MNELVIFNPIKAEISLALANLNSITKVTDEQGAMIATLGLKQITAAIGQVNALHKSVKQPHLDNCRMVDEFKNKTLEEPLKCQTNLKRVLLEWNSQVNARKEKQRQELEAAKRVEDERRMLEKSRDVTPPVDDFDALLDAPGDQVRAAIIKEANVEVEQFVADKTHQAAVKELDKKAVKGVRKVWRFEIKDQGLVPREFLMVDEMAVRKALNLATGPDSQGMIEIPGIRFYQDEIMAAR